MKIIYTIILFFSTSVCFAENNNTTQDLSTSPSLTNNLKNLISNGSFSGNLFKALANTCEDPVEKIAYARQAMVLIPQDKEIRKIIIDTKIAISTNEAPSNSLQKNSILDTISTKSFLPFYVEDYSIIFLSLIVLFSQLIKSKMSKIFKFFVILSFIYLLSNKIFVTYTRDGSLRFINSIDEIFKTEGISIKEVKLYAAKETSSQITYILPKGAELDLYSNSPKKGDWIKIGYENSRSGWTIYDPEKIYYIIR